MASTDDLHAYARTFPSQGGVEIGAWLYRYAANVEPRSAIVELGCWLGGGTAHLALGAMESGAEIHTYDRFFCPNEEEKEKALARGGLRLKIGQDTLPHVKNSLARFPVNIHYHKQSVKNGAFTWDSGPIGLYVDDLTKSDAIWLPVIAQCLPNFIPNKTHLFLQDFHFDEEAGPVYAAQKRWMAKHGEHFGLIEDRLAGTTCALFRYLG